MESTTKMEENNGEIIRAMLPNYFKRIGMVLVLLPIALGIFNKLNPLELIEAKKAVFMYVVKSIVLLGLLFIAGAKEKTETKNTYESRHRAMFSAGLLGILITIIEPLIDLLAGDPIEPMSAHRILTMMLVFYIVMFQTYKKGVIGFGVRRQSDQ